MAVLNVLTGEGNMDYPLVDRTTNAVAIVQDLLDCTKEQAVEIVIYACAQGCTVAVAFRALYPTIDDKAELFRRARIW